MASAPPHFSDLTYGSFLVYPARLGRPLTESEERAKSFLLRVKQMRVDPAFDPSSLVDWSIQQLLEHLPGTPLDQFFDDRECAVIAAPGAALTLPHGVSAPVGLCRALVTYGLARRVLPRIVRTKSVPKSAFAKAGERTGLVAHYESMAVQEPVLDPPGRIIVVDDIVTKGSTLLAAATRVREAYRDATVYAFALARTAPLPTGCDNDEVVGRVFRYGAHARREP